MRWIFGVLAVIVSQTTILASEVVVLGDVHIRVADSYSGTAFFTIDSSPDSSAWKKVDFSIGMSFLSMNVYQILPGIGESVMEVRYGDQNESWLI